MRINIGSLCRTVFCALILFVPWTLTVVVPAMSQPNREALKGISGSLIAATAHQSFIRIEDTGGPI